MSFNTASIFELLPAIAIAGLALIIAITAWFLVRNIIPPAPGVVLGHYEIIGRYVGSRFKKTYKGLLVDSTSFFLNPDAQNAFLDAIVKPFVRRALRDAEKNAALDKTYYENIKMLNDFLKSEEKIDLRQILRVYAMRSAFKKYLFIQWGRVEKPLTEYAFKDMESKFTFSFGPQPQGTVIGRICEAPSIRTPIGRVGAVLIVPDNPENPKASMSDIPNEIRNILYLVPHLPTIIEYKEILRSKEEEARRYRIQSEELARQNAELQAKINTLEISLFGSEGEAPSAKPDLTKLVAIILPCIAGYYLAEALGIAPIIGVILGALIGVILARRG